MIRLTCPTPGTAHIVNSRNADVTLLEGNQQTQLAESLRFETLLVDLSSKFVNLPTQEVDGEIEAAQRRICECLNLDLCVLWRVLVGVPQDFILTHAYLPPQISLPETPMKASEFFP
jgi:formate hydrogenlyase transcriptional activator